MLDINSFSDLIYPISEDEFFTDYHLKKHIHIKAEDKNKLRSVMSWSKLNEILNMNAFWAPSNLKLFLDTKPIGANDYCDAVGGSGEEILFRPNPQKVNHWLSRGASIVADDVDTLSSGLRNAANILEERLSGKVQSNLYCSWKQHQAFPVHMDSHDVFALHVEGQKVWRIYKGKIDEPINHPMFNEINAQNTRDHAGDVLEEIVLNPGDVLYIPRGVFHDALASSEGCIHLSFGVTHIIGYDVLSLLFNKALSDPLFRRNMPMASRPEAEKRSWLKELSAKALSILSSEEMYLEICEGQNNYKHHRGGFNIPHSIDNKNENFLELSSPNFVLITENRQTFLSKGNMRVNIPPDIIELVNWVITKRTFTVEDLSKKFEAMEASRIDYAIENLKKMNVLQEV